MVTWGIGRGLVVSRSNLRLCGAGRVAEKRGGGTKRENEERQKKSKRGLGLGIWMAG